MGRATKVNQYSRSCYRMRTDCRPFPFLPFLFVAAASPGRDFSCEVAGAMFDGGLECSEPAPSGAGMDGPWYLSAHSVRGFTLLAGAFLPGIIDSEMPGGAP